MRSSRATARLAALFLTGCVRHWSGPPPGYSERQPAEEARRTSPAPAAPESAPPAPQDQVPKEAPAGAEADVSPFPVGTRSLTVRDQAHVREEPSNGARYIGKITRGTRVAWKRVLTVEAADAEVSAKAKPRRKSACPAWVEIEPRGFLCRDLLTPSPSEPKGVHQPVVAPGRVAPDDYFHVSRNETKVFEKAEDVATDTVKEVLSTKVMVVGTGVVDVEGTPFVRTDHGLIEAALLAKYWPSDFSGIDLRETPPPAWPFAWVYAVRGGRGPDVFSGPSDEAPLARRAKRREIVSVLEEREGFVRIGGSEWIDRKHLRVAARAAPPPGIGPREQWIDVDLDEQVLVAYEGGDPVFATLVSTGKKNHETPPGTYRVRAKAATTTMADDPSIPNRYEVSAVPWAVRFKKGLFIHGVYWHDGFGGILSHGCVNVSPKDAAFLFEWVEPAVPDGWSEVEVPPGGGIVVRLRDRAHPSPPPVDYAKEDAKQ